MKASSESGLWAMVISRTGTETDEDDISKILQHSYLNARWKLKTLRKNLFGADRANKNDKPGLVRAGVHMIRSVLRMDFHRRIRRGGRAAQMPAQTPPHGTHGHQNGHQREG